MLKTSMTAACAAAILCGTPPATAEPASADPTFLLAANAPRPREIADFELGGAAFSVIATGRLAAADTDRASDALEEAIEMAEVLPGYPQPALVTVDLRWAF